MSKRWSSFLNAFYSHLSRLIGFLVVVVSVTWYLLQDADFSLQVVGYLCSIILVILIYTNSHMLAILSDIRDILDKLEKRLFSKMNPCSNRDQSHDEEIRTSGAGALAGMVLGGLVGLLGGPAGVIIGGIIGALVGNQIEYERLKAERERQRQQR